MDLRSQWVGLSLRASARTCSVAHQLLFQDVCLCCSIVVKVIQALGVILCLLLLSVILCLAVTTGKCWE